MCNFRGEFFFLEKNVKHGVNAIFLKKGKTVICCCSIG